MTDLVVSVGRIDPAAIGSATMAGSIPDDMEMVFGGTILAYVRPREDAYSEASRKLMLILSDHPKAEIVSRGKGRVFRVSFDESSNRIELEAFTL